MTELVVQKLLTLVTVLVVTWILAPSGATQAPITTQATACRLTWLRNGSSCYLYISSGPEKKKWEQAENDCVSRGGNLVSISSSNENEFVWGLSGQSIWIGLYNTKGAGTFVWSDGTNSSYDNWENTKGKDDCVRMKDPQGKWKRQGCNGKARYVCEYRLNASSTSTDGGNVVKTTATAQQQTARGTTPSPKSSTQKQTNKQTTTTAATTDNQQTTTPAAVTTELKTAAITTQTQKTTVLPTTSTATSTAATQQTTSAATTQKQATASDRASASAAATQKKITASATPPITSSAAATSQRQATASATTSVPSSAAAATLKQTTRSATTLVSTSTAATSQKRTISVPSSAATTSQKQTTAAENTPIHRPKTTDTVVHTTKFPTSRLTTIGKPKSTKRLPAGITSEPSSITSDPDNSIVANLQEQEQTSADSSTLYAGIGAAIAVCVVLSVIIFILVIRRRRTSKGSPDPPLRNPPLGSEDRSVGIMNLTYDAVSFIKGSDSMKESEVYCAPYCAPYTMNRDSKAQGEDGYVTCKFTNEGEKSKVEFKLAEASRDSTKENYLESITASAVYGNSEYEEIPCRDDQQEEDLLTDRGTSVSTRDDDMYWEPASKENELYGQLEKHKFRYIARCDVTDRKEIGSGEFGVVEKAMWQMGKDKKITVAVKTLMNKSKSEADERVKFLREGAINGQFHNRNVIRLHGVVTVGSPLMLVLEYMENGDLKNYLMKQRPGNSGQPCPDDMPFTLLQMCRDIARGMEYLARKQFVHRDLAARNVLLNDKLTCKIGDFGMARDVSEDNYYVTNGGKVPLRWCAPETWLYKKFSSASDVWSYGVLLYEIWSLGERPFGPISNREMMDKVECGYRLPPPPGCSRSLYHLMIDCWNPDRQYRPSFGNILQKLAASDDSLLTTACRDCGLEGNLGDEVEGSNKCFVDLQGMYGWK